LSRNAIISSLALHAGLISWIGWGWTLPAGGGDAGREGTEPSLVLEDAGGALPSASLPAANGRQLFAGAEFVPQTPSETLSAPPIAFATLEPAPFTVAFNATPAISLEKFDDAGFKSATPRVARKRTRTGGNGCVQRGVGSRGSGGGVRGGNFVPPRFRVRYKPPYPEEARAQRLEGTVLLLVSVDTGGEVTGAEVMTGSGHPVLDRAALAAIRSWRFEPARQDGVAIATRVEVPVRFCFEERRVAVKVNASSG